jgi:hypothetical protein
MCALRKGRYVEVKEEIPNNKAKKPSVLFEKDSSR